MTLEEFKLIPAGEIFRVVTTKYQNVQRVNNRFPELTFVCKKGDGYDDWAIYYHYPKYPPNWIALNGDKVTVKENIFELFPCTDEVMDLYRF